MEILVDAATDRKDVFYVMVDDVRKLFRDRKSGACYVQLAIPRPTLAHPDDVVIELARIIASYDIVEDLAC